MTRTLTIVTVGDEERPASDQDVAEFKKAYVEAFHSGNLVLTHHVWHKIEVPITNEKSSLPFFILGDNKRPITDLEIEKVQDDLRQLLSSEENNMIYFTWMPVRVLNLPFTSAVL